MEFLPGDCKNELPILTNNTKADIIVLDSPRKGCSTEVLAAAAAANPRSIVYVSCNPATLARDCKILSEQGYRVKEAWPVDMFPQTGTLSAWY